MIVFSELDFFSLLDADSDEARTFTTYLGYWVCLADHVQHLYGDEPAQAILTTLSSRKPYRALPGKGKATDPDGVQSLLLNGWTSELRLHLIDLDDRHRLPLANHGAPVDAYYATSRHATAWLVARDGQAPETHRGLLNAVSSLVTGSRLLPPPWDLHCPVLLPAPAYTGFTTDPRHCSNLAIAADRTDRAAMLLRTTRRRQVDKKVEEVKQRQKRQRAANGEAGRQDSATPSTTTFDFAWRMRARSHYGDPAMFYVGSLDHQRARAYAAAVRTWTTATMFLFEALVAQRARDTLLDAAVHFISRDRSGLADRLLMPRLRLLGLANDDL